MQTRSAAKLKGWHHGTQKRQSHNRQKDSPKKKPSAMPIQATLSLRKLGEVVMSLWVAPVCASRKCEVAQMPMEYGFAPVRQLRQSVYRLATGDWRRPFLRQFSRRTS